MALALLAAAGPLFASRSARAQTMATAVLDVERSGKTKDCASAAALQAAVVARLGRKVFVSGADADLKVKLRFSRAPDGKWQALLSVRSRTDRDRGERELTTSAPQCSALDDSLALVMALMLDVSQDEIVADEEEAAAAQAQAQAQSEEAPGSHAEPRKPPPSPIQLPVSPQKPPAPWRLALGAYGQTALGALPNVAFGGGLSFTVAPPVPFYLTLEIGAWLPQTIDGPEGATAQLTAGAAVLYACHPWGRSLIWAACIGQRVALTDSLGAGFDHDDHARSISYGLGIRGQIGIDLGAVSLYAGPGLDVPISRGQFYYVRADGSSGTLFKAAPVVGTATVGMTLDL